MLVLHAQLLCGKMLNSTSNLLYLPLDGVGKSAETRCLRRQLHYPHFSIRSNAQRADPKDLSKQPKNRFAQNKLIMYACWK